MRSVPREGAGLLRDDCAVKCTENFAVRCTENCTVRSPVYRPLAGLAGENPGLKIACGFLPGPASTSVIEEPKPHGSFLPKPTARFDSFCVFTLATDAGDTCRIPFAGF